MMRRLFSCGDHLPPANGWLPRLHVIGQAARCSGNDLQASRDEGGPIEAAEKLAAAIFAGALTSAIRQPEATSALIRLLAPSEAAPVILEAGLMPPSERQLARSVRPAD